MTKTKVPANHQVACRAHCTSCGRHFHSTAAFDEHRHHEYGTKKDWEGPGIVKHWCDAPGVDNELELRGIGICSNGPTRLEDQEIWQQ